jgi:hypothetical protein
MEQLASKAAVNAALKHLGIATPFCLPDSPDDTCSPDLPNFP